MRPWTFTMINREIAYIDIIQKKQNQPFINNITIFDINKDKVNSIFFISMDQIDVHQ